MKQHRLKEVRHDSTLRRKSFSGNAFCILEEKGMAELKMDTVVERLTSYTTSLNYEDIPPEVIHQGKRLLVDTLGCALGGYTSEPSRIAREEARDIRSTQTATVLWSGDKTSVDLATFANGIMMRYLDYNDFNQSAHVKDGGHPSDAFAAVLSPAELAKRDGKTTLLGVVLAWEIMGRLANAAVIRSRGFDYPTNIAIAGACAAARMFGLSREQTAHAIGLTATANVGLGATRYGDVAMWKGCAAANGCRNAVFAARMAAKGMTGPLEVFEGRSGFIKALTEDGRYDLEESFGGNGTPFLIMESSIKNYPCGSVAQTAVDCALAIRPKLSSIANIEQINIRTFGSMLGGVMVNIMADGLDKWHPENRETADHSMPYCVGVAFMYGGIEVRHFGNQYLHNPELLNLIQKINIEVADECVQVYPEQRLNIVEVVTRSGERFEERLGYHKGHPKNPLTDLELEKKFRSLAEGLLPERQTNIVLDALWNLDQFDDFGKVIRMMQV
jgi:2-methylcitrate dehydratase